MKVLFCELGFSESRRKLAPLMPDWHVAACTKDTILANLESVDVVVPYGAAISREIIARGSFGLIQQFGVGLETVDVAAATAAGVWVARVPSAGTGNAESVAEHAIFLMLALSRKFTQASEALRERLVGEPAGSALIGKTACIIGLGGVGTALAERLKSFQMRIIGVRAKPELGAATGLEDLELFGAADLSKAVARADYVIVCVTQTTATEGFINQDILRSMKRGALLVNVARGKLVEVDALLDALRSGRILGAGLDVFPEEPIDPDHELFRYNVVATPHIAGVTDVSYDGIARMVAENLYRFAKGEPPHHAVNNPPIARWSPQPLRR